MTSFALLSLALCAAFQEPPRTVPEESEYARTTTCAEAEEFLRRVRRLPAAERLSIDTLGRSNQDRDLTLWIVADPPLASASAVMESRKLRVLVNANIHGGEVEGKEACLALLREFASGDHGDLLKKLVVLFVPIYNADGNDAIARENRSEQNGPRDGVGLRANAQGLDLNRDFVKVESPECDGLMRAFRLYDPHLFVDLHTTNGSAHGYHLTYSPSLSTNVDPRIDRSAREVLLPMVRNRLRRESSWRVFDYGNFSGPGPDEWATYDHRPRFGTNYYGLRNRIAVLSEAYSYVDFESRVAVTREFVLALLESVAGLDAYVKNLCDEVDERARDRGASLWFGHDTTLEAGRFGDVLVGTVTEEEWPDGSGTRKVAGSEAVPTRMKIRDGFESRAFFELPFAWLLVEPSAPVLARLRAHGVEFEVLARATELELREFTPLQVRRAERAFQGHQEVRVLGVWDTLEREVPAGTIVVPGRQRLARVAAQLLAPESEDSLATWNFFDEALEAGRYPVLRLERGMPLPFEEPSCVPDLVQRTYEAVAVPLRGGVLLYGGMKQGTDSADVTFFDPERGEWRDRAPMNVPRSFFCGEVLDGFAYAVSGRTAEVERYDFDRDAWTPVAPIPRARTHSVCVAHEGRLWVLAGFGGEDLSRVDVYDPATDSWSEGPELPFAGHGQAACSFGGRLHVFGGSLHGEASMTRGHHVLVDGAWLELTPLPAAVLFAEAEALGDRILVVGGPHGGGFAYSGETGRWSTLAEVPTALYHYTSTTWRGRFVALGGVRVEAGEGPLGYSEVWTYDPLTDRWCAD